MGLDDVVSGESAFVAAATAAVFSPKTRETLRRGAVIGVAGALKAGDVVVGAARGVARGVRGQQQGSATAGDGAAPAPDLPAAPAPRSGTRGGTRSTRGGTAPGGGATS